MDFNESAERIVIAKPIASRLTSSFRSFSELVADSTNGSPSSVTAIRPKTVRFKPVLNSPPVELSGTQSCHLSDKILNSNHMSPLIYKPLAKTVSRTTISLLANMETFNASNEQVVSQNLQIVTPMKSRNDKRPQLNTNNSDRPSYDGYNWRKYGQKQVKGSEYPRSYYKCTHHSCLVKKKVERSIDGEIAEIVYKGEHNHSKPRLPRRHLLDGTSENPNCQSPNNQINDDNEVFGSSSNLNDLVKLHESYSNVIMETADDVPSSKRRKNLTKNETFGEGLQEPHVVVHDGIDPEAISDGFRWRKYGQKVVKGNPYPRSYYRCTGVKCNVRKHVERASDDPGVFITTYEGKHNHEMPIKKAN